MRTIVFFIGMLLFSGLSYAATCTVIIDEKSGRVLYRDGDCASRVSPCSTFKIPLALMAADAGVITAPHDPLLPYRSEYLAVIPSHKADTDPTTWLQNSVVWYSQQLTPRVGEDAFARYVDLFGYGNKDVSGDPGKHNGLTQSWLGSSIAISPDEQVTFLRNLRVRAFSLKPSAYLLTEKIVPVFNAEGGWIVHGKTGSGFQRNAAGENDGHRKLGWFVGWAEKGGRRIVFARLILDETDIAAWGGPRAKESFLSDLPGLIEEKAKDLEVEKS